jgi:FkbM family methyltransferase
MDEETYSILQKLNLEKIKLIPIKKIEDQELLEAKKTRNEGEYCWTCKPSLMLHLLNNYKLDLICYLDADTFFYSSPKAIYDDLKTGSILITSHRFSPNKKHLETNGIYNAGLLAAKNDASGIECLNWWREKCNEWCYRQPSEGRLGDQKYIDQFPVLFKNVIISQNIGINAAPWNLNNYKISKNSFDVLLDDELLVLYHFFQFEIYPPSPFLPPCPWSHYLEKSPANKYIYSPYIKEFYKSLQEIKKVDKNFSFGLTPRPTLLKTIKEIIIPLIKDRLKYSVKKTESYIVKTRTLTGKIQAFKRKNFVKKYNIISVAPCYQIINKLDEKSIIVDIGTGDNADFSQAMIKGFSLKCYGFDPTKKHFNSLKTLEAKSNEHFKIFNYALCAQKGKKEFHESRQNISGSFSKEHINIRRDESISYQVETITLADIFKIIGHAKIDLLKMDAEGEEYEIIKSVDKVTLEKINQLVIEFHHHCIGGLSYKDTQHCLKILTSHGFKNYTTDKINYLFFK